MYSEKRCAELSSPPKLPIGKIRQQTYDYHKYHDKSPYTWFKARIYMELASILVYFTQYTNIHPNILTILYLILGICGAIALNIPHFTLIGVVICYFKGTFDWADGHLARIKGLETDFGRKLDILAGYINVWAFYFGLAAYLLINLYIHQKISLIFYAAYIIVPLRMFQDRTYLFSGRASSVDTFLALILLDKILNIV